MVPIPGGEYLLGSPASEADRGDDEGPQVKVKIEPFWMGKYEVTWEEYDVWSFGLDIQRRKLADKKPTPLDLTADVVTKPTKPYTDMTFGMGHDGYPAICMTQLAAKTYCQWLSEKTGHYYRLPTEAEWEKSGRGKRPIKYPWGDSPPDSEKLNYNEEKMKTTPVGTYEKGKSDYGIYDLSGNVSEWVHDWHFPEYYLFSPKDLGHTHDLVECDATLEAGVVAILVFDLPIHMTITETSFSQ